MDPCVLSSPAPGPASAALRQGDSGPVQLGRRPAGTRMLAAGPRRRRAWGPVPRGAFGCVIRRAGLRTAEGARLRLRVGLGVW